jgi:hypothetical protein
MIQVNFSENDGFRPVIVAEEVYATIIDILKFSESLLDRIDHREKLTHAVIATTILGAEHFGWRTADEQLANPHSFPVSLAERDLSPISLSPPHRNRSTLRMNADKLAEDLTVLLRRRFMAQI